MTKSTTALPTTLPTALTTVDEEEDKATTATSMEVVTVASAATAVLGKVKDSAGGGMESVVGGVGGVEGKSEGESEGEGGGKPFIQPLPALSIDDFFRIQEGQVEQVEQRNDPSTATTGDGTTAGASAALVEGGGGGGGGKNLFNGNGEDDPYDPFLTPPSKSVQTSVPASVPASDQGDLE